MYNSNLKQKQNQKSQQLKHLLKRKEKKKEQTQQELSDQACKNQIYSFKGQNYKLFQKNQRYRKITPSNFMTRTVPECCPSSK